jgi:LPS-assembly lipoprotein
MWWREGKAARIVVRLAVAGAIAGLTAGCFQPLYGESSQVSGPGIRDAMAAVAVQPIAAPAGTPEANIAVELRDALLFALGSNPDPVAPAYQLAITMSSTRRSVIVDIDTARPDMEVYGINANYTLTDLKTRKPVLSGQTFSRVTFDIPGQAQRFARDRGERDAEKRAAGVIAENIKSRLASYFVSGG